MVSKIFPLKMNRRNAAVAVLCGVLTVLLIGIGILYLGTEGSPRLDPEPRIATLRAYHEADTVPLSLEIDADGALAHLSVRYEPDYWSETCQDEAQCKPVAVECDAPWNDGSFCKKIRLQVLVMDHIRLWKLDEGVAPWMTVRHSGESMNESETLVINHGDQSARRFAPEREVWTDDAWDVALGEHTLLKKIYTLQPVRYIIQEAMR